MVDDSYVVGNVQLRLGIQRFRVDLVDDRTFGEGKIFITKRIDRDHCVIRVILAWLTENGGNPMETEALVNREFRCIELTCERLYGKDQARHLCRIR